ncbi:MAG TPA: hypothetical protein PLS53_00010 [Thermoanaerobaculaceae bacterium]|nr:hypothetical protein [Thermoanaerobaculaceae bacterium]
MLLCKIHNTVTDQHYAFEAHTQAEIDAKLARKDCYGRPARTEVIPAWTETQDSPTWPLCPTCTFPLGSNACPECQASPLAEPGAVIEHPETSVVHPAERVVEIVDLATQELALARKAAIDAVQARLDLFAQSWGYDNILSLCSYATSKVPRFATEAQIGIDFRDQTWAAVMQYETTVATLAELIDLLPPVPTRMGIP